MSAALQLPQMSDAEWEARCELAAVYHVNEHLGWTDTINTHMTVRVPGEPNHFLINNYGDMFDEVTASSLVKMDMEGNVLTPGGRFNNAGFTIHSAIYKARPDANCVLHTHTRAGAAVSLLRNGLRPISQDVLGVYDEIAYHTYGVIGRGMRRTDEILRPWQLHRSGKSRTADVRRNGAGRDDAHVVVGTRLRVGSAGAADERGTRSHQQLRHSEGRRAVQEAPGDEGIRAERMEGPCSSGGTEGLRFPSLIEARGAVPDGTAFTPRRPPPP